MRYGLGWRPELGTSILCHLDEVDVVEVLAEEYTEATTAEKRALRFLARQVPVVVHGTSLGLASSEPVDAKRLDATARLIDWLQPEAWSEHLAFVRGGGIEIGHLAAPPRNDRTLDGLRRNVDAAVRATGIRPQLENVASLVDPPLSTYDEGSWLAEVTATTDCELLLDLHNLHANATNFRFDARDVLATIPHGRIGAIHLAGGRRIEGDRILDDHLHDVPDAVYELLALVDAPDATLILERDGNYPEFDSLLAQLRAARNVIACERPARRTPTPPARSTNDSPELTPAFLASIYADDAARSRFLEAPYATARAAGLGDTDASALAEIDRDGLALAARSFAKKRNAKAHHAAPRRWWQRR